MAAADGRKRSLLWALLGAAAGVAACSTVAIEPAEAQPEIRTSERNRVPACVTPDRLMQFLASGNRNLPSQFRSIADYYKQHGEKYRVRWDYAFYQMIIETNYLKFVNNAGQGDVKAKQNNFAGLGTTGGGVPGDSYPDVSTGVLAQIQHLVVYSGERLDNPVGARTREKQDEILGKSRALNRAVTFQDLSGRWAVDRRYGRSIEFVATRFRSAHCNGREERVAEATPPPAKLAETRGGKRARGGATADRTLAEAKTEGDEQRRALGGANPLEPAKPEPIIKCAVLTASYGGERNVLIRSVKDTETQYTALQVLDGQEQRLAESYIRTHATGGEKIGEFPSRLAALKVAFDYCPSARKN